MDADDTNRSTTIARCRELVATAVMEGAIAAVPGLVLELTPRSRSSVDVSIKGISPNGTRLDGITRVQHVAEHRHAVLVDASGQGWSWGDFLQGRDEPDLTEDEVTHAATGIDDATNDAICAEIARIAVGHALENPLAMRAATVLQVSDALAATRGDELRLGARMEALRANGEALEARLAREIDRCEAEMDLADAPAPGM